MIREKRKAMGLSMQTLSSSLGISTSALSRYERLERPWPPELLQRVLTILGLPSGPSRDWLWSWSQHRRFVGHTDCATTVDPGQTWADLPRAYAHFYQALQPDRVPPLEFRRLVRADSSLEPCFYTHLCENGAEWALISPEAMGFPYHPLVTEDEKPLGRTRRAAFVWEGWIFWPQVNILINRQKIRVDALAFNGRQWRILEFDSALHTSRTRWDQLRDSWLIPPTIRFTAEELLSVDFIRLLRERLANPQQEAA